MQLARLVLVFYDAKRQRPLNVFLLYSPLKWSYCDIFSLALQLCVEHPRSFDLDTFPVQLLPSLVRSFFSFHLVAKSDDIVDQLAMRAQASTCAGQLVNCVHSSFVQCMGDFGAIQRLIVQVGGSDL